MKKAAVFLIAMLLPATVAAAEIKGTIVKVDTAQNRLVLKTERGEETFQITKESKGVDHVKQGANVVIRFSEKDGEAKIGEIAPGD